jgi:hypothetical protein
MPIIIHTHSGQQIVARGEHLGVWNRILLALRQPLTVRAMATDDVHTVTPNSISHIQTFSDVEGERRRKDYEARQKAAQDAEKRRNPSPGPGPRHVIPTSRG